MTGVRRVVTGHDTNGKAVVLSDGKAPFLSESSGRPGFWSTDLWRTTATPTPIAANEPEPTLGPRRQLPTSCGTVVRINHIPPEAGRLDQAAARKEFAALGNEAASTFKENGRHPMMHRTETVDYAIVISGEIYLVLDDSEVLLQAGDMVVQRGTNHAWSNRSTAGCVIAFILIDGAFDNQLHDLLD